MVVKQVNASSFLVLGLTSAVLFGFQNCSPYKAAQSQSATYSQVLGGSSTVDSGSGAGTDPGAGANTGATTNPAPNLKIQLLDSGTPVLPGSPLDFTVALNQSFAGPLSIQIRQLDSSGAPFSKADDEIMTFEVPANATQYKFKMPTRNFETSLNARTITMELLTTSIGQIERTKATGQFKQSQVPARFKSITEGDAHFCGVGINDRAYCWGNNRFGQLGDGTNITRTTPAEVPGLGNVIRVIASGNHSCALTAGRLVYCWGVGGDGQLGTGGTNSFSTPIQVPGLSQILDIGLGRGQSCAIAANRNLYCWGHNTVNAEGNKLIPNLVRGASNIVQVSGGNSYTCALTAQGEVLCIGILFDGRSISNSVSLNNYTQENGVYQIVAKPVAGLSNIVEISTGYQNLCARNSQGQVYCMGDGLNGGLGHGTEVAFSATPVLVQNLNSPSRLAGSIGNSNCAVSNGTSIRCWGWLPGSNPRQKVTVATEIDQSPGGVKGLTGSCHLNANDELICHESSVRSHNPQQMSLLPMDVKDLGPIKHVDIGSYELCVVTNLGKVRCARYPANILNASAYVEIPNLNGVKQVSSGGSRGWGPEHVCALTDAGEVKCWKGGFYGQFGNGVSQSSNVPITVPGLIGVKAIASGEAYVCGLTANDTVKCWGNLPGVAPLTGSIAVIGVPNDIPGLTDIKQVVSGARHVCGLTKQGLVKCWGQNQFGQLGTGDTNSSPTAITVPGLSGIKKISAAGSHTCVITALDTVKCWGSFSGGYYSDAQGALIGLDSGTPVDILGLNGILDLFSGPTHSCAKDLLGRTSCWGSNGHGQFGNGTATWSPTPRDSPGLYNMRQVASGYQTSAGISAGGHLKVWGVISNSVGRTSITVPTP